MSFWKNRIIRSLLNYTCRNIPKNNSNNNLFLYYHNPNVNINNKNDKFSI